MQIFLDTANINDIVTGVSYGCVSGVTTNPTIISRENKPFHQCIRNIAAVDPELIILAEAVEAKTQDMVKEARELSGLSGNIVVKIPMTEQGLAAVRQLSAESIPTAVTLVFSLNQAIAASCAGADYVAPFVGRLDDINGNGIDVVRSIKETYVLHCIKTRVIAASLRTPQTVSELFKVGCDIVTVPISILGKMLRHPLTDAGLKKFEEDWGKCRK